jgi:sugar/nucleoside kinase (ribokinase family)
MSLVIVGSMAFDTIETPWERKEKIIGGSCTFGSVAAGYFTRPGVVAAVGEDFPADVLAFLRKRHVDLRGLQIVPGGKTFHWQGRYGADPNQRETIRTDLNCFAEFHPQIPPAYRKADILLLANIGPDLQDAVLKQVEKPRLTAMDTICLWIQSQRESLQRILRSVDIYFGNDEEVRMLTDERNVVKAARIIQGWGPRLVIVKKGEHGALVFGPDFVFGLPARPTATVVDPTGAGDAFAGGFLGYLDQAGGFSRRAIRRAAVYGSVMASFTIEGFGIDRYKTLKPAEVAARYQEFKTLVTF